MAMEFFLVPTATRVESNGDGQPVDISASRERTFFCTLVIADQIEQESLDVSIWGSEDGQNWGAKPLLKLPQQFYRGHAHMVLDVSLRPELKFLRAHWDLVRWGRVAPTPMFVFSLHLREVAAFPGRTVAEKASAAAT